MKKRSPAAGRWSALWTVAMLAVAGCSPETPAPKPDPAAAGAESTGAAKQVSFDTVMQRDSGVEVEGVTVRAMPRVLRVTGNITVNENRTWRVGSIAEGRIIRVYANPGDLVEKGQVLARMHSHETHESRAHYRRATLELARLKSAEAYAVRVRDRARRLYELKAGSLAQVEQSETELKNAQAAVAHAQVEVERTAQHLVEFLQVPLEEPEHHHRDEELGDEELIPVKAPAAGVVLSRSVTPGTVVNPSGELFTISDLSQLWMIAAVSEESLSSLRAGSRVKVFVQAYPEAPFEGRIARIDEALDATTRTVKARVEISNHHGRLKPEMYATAEIAAGASQPGLFIPRIAIQEVNGESVVFVQKSPGQFETRPVQAGPAGGGSVEILRGLAAGESVVTKGSFLLKSQLLKSTLAEE